MSKLIREHDQADALRARLAEVEYTTERLEEALGGGRISLSPADLAVHERRLAPHDPLAALVRLFLLGQMRSVERAGLNMATAAYAQRSSSSRMAIS